VAPAAWLAPILRLLTSTSVTPNDYSLHGNAIASVYREGSQPRRPRIFYPCFVDSSAPSRPARLPQGGIDSELEVLPFPDEQSDDPRLAVTLNHIATLFVRGPPLDHSDRRVVVVTGSAPATALIATQNNKSTVSEERPSPIISIQPSGKSIEELSSTGVCF